MERKIEVDPDRIRELKKKIQKESTTHLFGLDSSSGLVAECPFAQVPYTDKITGVKLAGQPHVMFKGGTGIGKTDLVQSFAMSLEAKFSRISCTPDLMPYDITGGQVLVENLKGERRVQFKPGPIFAHIVLLDEANRCQSKTKGAILEAMEERSHTPKTEYINDDDRVVNGALPLFPLSANYSDITSPRFFMVFMTENIFGEEEGTYPNTMAELDRTTLAIPIERPSFEEEKKIRAANVLGKSIKPIVNLEEILACADWITKNVEYSPQADEYLTRLLRNTDPHPKVTDPKSKLGKFLAEYVQVGESPRVNFHLEAVPRVRAFFEGSLKVKPDHVKAVAPNVLAHRLVLKPGKEFTTTKEKVLEEILRLTAQPPWK